MCGLQCPKKLWQTVYDPEPAEEPQPGTVKGMGIEVGIKARLLWPGGVLPEGLAVIAVPVYELGLYELLRAFGERGICPHGRKANRLIDNAPALVSGMIARTQAGLTMFALARVPA
jgi:hypothetical protein